MVVQQNLSRSDVFDLSDVKGAFGIISDSDEFANSERRAVNFVELSVGVGLGLYGAKGQNVRDDPLIPSLGGVVDGGVGGGAEALQDGARSSPGSDALGPPAGLQKLGLGGEP